MNTKLQLLVRRAKLKFARVLFLKSFYRTTVNYNDTILYRYWKYRGFFIEASKFQPNRHPLPSGMTNTYNEYTLAIVDYDENNLIIHSFIGNFFQLEYEKTIDYDIDENILELKKHYN